MQDAVDLVLQLGRFAMTVIVVCVAIMLVISFVDGRTRNQHTPNDQDRKD